MVVTGKFTKINSNNMVANYSRGDDYYSDEEPVPAVPPIPDLAAENISSDGRKTETGDHTGQQVETFIDEPLKLGTRAEEEKFHDISRSESQAVEPVEGSVVATAPSRPESPSKISRSDTEGEYPEDIYGYYENDTEHESEKQSLNDYEDDEAGVSNGIQDLTLGSVGPDLSVDSSMFNASNMTATETSKPSESIRETDNSFEEPEPAATRGRWQPIEEPKPPVVPPSSQTTTPTVSSFEMKGPNATNNTNGEPPIATFRRMETVVRLDPQKNEDKPEVPPISTSFKRNASSEATPQSSSTVTPQTQLTKEILGTFGEHKPEEYETADETDPDPELLALYANSSQFLTRPISQYDFDGNLIAAAGAQGSSGTEPLSMHKSHPSVDSTRSNFSSSSYNYDQKTRPLSVIGSPRKQDAFDSEATPKPQDYGAEFPAAEKTAEPVTPKLDRGESRGWEPDVPAITTTQATPERVNNHGSLTATSTHSPTPVVALDEQLEQEEPMRNSTGPVQQDSSEYNQGSKVLLDNTSDEKNVKTEDQASNAGNSPRVSGEDQKKHAKSKSLAQFDDFDEDYSYLDQGVEDTRELNVENTRNLSSVGLDNLEMPTKSHDDSASIVSGISVHSSGETGTMLYRPNEEDNAAEETAEENSTIPFPGSESVTKELPSPAADQIGNRPHKQSISQKLNRPPRFDFNTTLNKPRATDRIAEFTMASDRELMWNSGLDNWLKVSYSASRKGAGLYTTGKPPPPTQQEARMAVPSRTMSTSFIRPAKHMGKEAFGKVGEKSKVARSLLLKGKKLIKTQPASQ